MTLIKMGFIVTHPDLDPERDRTVMTGGNFQLITVGVGRPEQGVEVARQLVEQDGAALLELCGGFGPVWTGKIIEAIGNRVPVGSVNYGCEAIKGLTVFLPPDPGAK